MNNELIKLIKQERPTGRMGNNNEPVWNAEKVYDLMVKAQQQVKKCDLDDVGKSLSDLKNGDVFHATVKIVDGKFEVIGTK